jgi:hypothetical protein
VLQQARDNIVNGAAERAPPAALPTTATRWG